MSRRRVALGAAAFALLLAVVSLAALVVTNRGDDDEYPCAGAWTATDAEYEAHVACDLALTRNLDRRMP